MAYLLELGRSRIDGSVFGSCSAGIESELERTAKAPFVGLCLVETSRERGIELERGDFARERPTFLSPFSFSWPARRRARRAQRDFALYSPGKRFVQRGGPSSDPTCGQQRQQRQQEKRPALTIDTVDNDWNTVTT